MSQENKNELKKIINYLAETEKKYKEMLNPDIKASEIELLGVHFEKIHWLEKAVSLIVDDILNEEIGVGIPSSS